MYTMDGEGCGWEYSKWTFKYMMAQMICGVGKLHELGIVHHDLKPSNILISGDGKIKISDFGLAVFAEKVTNII